MAAISDLVPFTHCKKYFDNSEYYSPKNVALLPSTTSYLVQVPGHGDLLQVQQEAHLVPVVAGGEGLAQQRGGQPPHRAPLHPVPEGGGYGVLLQPVAKTGGAGHLGSKEEFWKLQRK